MAKYVISDVTMDCEAGDVFTAKSEEFPAIFKAWQANGSAKSFKLSQDPARLPSLDFVTYDRGVTFSVVDNKVVPGVTKEPVEVEEV